MVLPFEYDLPEAAIAQVPVEPRSAARLLVHLQGPAPEHRSVSDLPQLVGPGDVLVVNDTRVLSARLRLHKATGGRVEVLLVEPLGEGAWSALVRPGRRLPPGTELLHSDGAVVAEVGRPMEDGLRQVQLHGELDDLADVAEVPLPPYIHQRLADPERYQTVYANHPGSVAAPTAGLHLTSEVLAACRSAGADVATVDLAVGIGTFRPMTAERVEDHTMHEERYRVPADTMAAVEAASRVIAVGTTTVRALESAAGTGSLEGRTGLFIRPGFVFRAVDVMLTNFHLPRSSLLVMLEAFYGPGWRELYATALAGGYRFLSFGDATLVARGAGHHS